MERENEGCEHTKSELGESGKGGFFRNPGKAKTCGTGDVHPGFWLDK